MGNVVKMTGNVPSKLLAKLGSAADVNDDLSAGVSGGFAVLAFRGSKWRIKSGGEEHPILNEDGDPISSLRVLILKGNRHISKNFYAGSYEEGSADHPDCFSVDGIHPDAGVESPVSKTCATCPNNVFGSRITESGKKAKACSDSRRLAVVPEGDFANELYGGPMLLRVPPASLNELAAFTKKMKAKNFPYNTIITRVSFDLDTAYPKLMFNAVRPLTDDEADTILEHLADEAYVSKMENVLAIAMEALPAKEEAEQEEESLFEDATPTPAPVKKGVAKKAPAKKKAPVKAKPVDEEEDEEEDEEKDEGDDLDADMKDILASLDSLD